MGVLNDYKCQKHGFFEAMEPLCPHGCTDVKVVFLKAPGIKSERTKKADRTLRGLARDFGMSNIKSTREGEAQSGYLTRNNAPAPQAPPPPQQPQAGNGVIWGGAGGMNLSTLTAGGAIRSVRGEDVGFKPRENLNLQGPKTASYIGDHENLKISK